MANEQEGHFLSSSRLVIGNRNGLFRQVVYDDEYIVIPMLVLIKGVEVYGYVLL